MLCAANWDQYLFKTRAVISQDNYLNVYGFLLHELISFLPSLKKKTFFFFLGGGVVSYLQLCVKLYHTRQS